MSISAGAKGLLLALLLLAASAEARPIVNQRTKPATGEQRKQTFRRSTNDVKRRFHEVKQRMRTHLHRR